MYHVSVFLGDEGEEIQDGRMIILGEGGEKNAPGWLGLGESRPDLEALMGSFHDPPKSTPMPVLAVVPTRAPILIG